MSLGLGPASAAIKDLLVASSALSAEVTSSDGEIRIYDHTPPRPVFPYVRVEGSGDEAVNTMGPSGVARLGSLSTVRARVCSQSRSEHQVATVAGLVRSAADRQRIAVSGFAGRPVVEYTRTIPIEDSVGAVVTREWLVEFELCLQQ
jgi:hypothetical protein